MSDCIRLSTLNTGNGGYPGFNEFTTERAAHNVILLFQEVHRSKKVMSLPIEFWPADPGKRRYTVRTHLADEIQTLIGNTHRLHFASQIEGCHDFEDPVTRGLYYGQLTAIPKQYKVRSVHPHMIYREHGALNEERNRGLPCAKVSQVFHIRHRGLEKPIIVVNLHGFTSIHGKVDIPARYEQNRGIAQAVERYRRRLFGQTAQVEVLLAGDLNYTSHMNALSDLLNQPIFGEGGGVNLNERFGITRTRTRYYQDWARVPEADFAIVSQGLAPYTSLAVNLDAPSDHGELQITIDC